MFLLISVSRPHLIHDFPPSLPADEGSNVKLKCRVRSGNPAPDVVWTRDGRVLGGAAAGLRARVKTKK